MEDLQVAADGHVRDRRGRARARRRARPRSRGSGRGSRAWRWRASIGSAPSDRVSRVGHAARRRRGRDAVILTPDDSPKSTKSNMIGRANSRESLDIAAPVRNNPASLGLADASRDGPRRRFRMADLDSPQAVTRRSVLKGGVAVAALGGVSAFLAACASAAATAAPALGSAGSQPASSRRSARRASRRRRHRHARLQLLRRRARRPAMQAIVDGFTAQDRRRRSPSTRSTTARSRTRSTRYLQAHPGRRVHVVRRLPHEVLRRPGPRDRHRRRLGDRSAPTTPTAFKAASTGDDGKQYFIPFYNYPWVVIYRKSLFAGEGLHGPETSTSSRRSATR